MEKSKDIVIEEGKAMLFGFIIALLICGFLLWAFNVKAQVITPTLKGYQTISTDSGGIQTAVLIDPKIMTASQLQEYSGDLKKDVQIRDTLLSKYAQLYDSCKNKR